jgi:hypothetical protein
MFFRKMSSTMDELAKQLGTEFANLINIASSVDYFR